VPGIEFEGVDIGSTVPECMAVKSRVLRAVIRVVRDDRLACSRDEIAWLAMATGVAGVRSPGWTTMRPGVLE
jgi:hypothetical protein